MRFHLAALVAASLFVLAAPRPRSKQALVQGIPLGDLVRPKGTTSSATTSRPEVPSERNPAISQLSPAPSGTTTLGTPSSTTPGTTLGTPSSSVGGATTPGLNLSNPGLPSTTPNSTTVGGAPTTTGVPSTGANSSTVGGMPSTTGATPPTGSSTTTPGLPGDHP